MSAVPALLLLSILTNELQVIPVSGIHFRLGAGIVGVDVVEPPTAGFSRTYINWKPSIPAGISYLFGHNQRNKFEIAAQAVYIFKMTVPEIWDKDLTFRSELSNEFIPSIFFGYRAKMLR
jgi:hypothetical protein